MRSLRVSTAFLVGILFPVCTTCAASQSPPLTIVIEDAPQEIPRYGPLVVTFSIHNNTRAPLLAPISARIVVDGRLLKATSPPSADWIPARSRFVWIAEVGRNITEVGEHSLEAVLESSGECVLAYPETVENETEILSPSDHPSRKAVVRCWSGRIASTPVKVMVSEPTAAIDIEARAAVESLATTPASLPTLLRLPETQAVLWRDFRASHYTTAAAIRGWNGPDPDNVFQGLIEAQPGSSQNRHLRALWAQAIIAASSTCGGAHRPRPSGFAVKSLDLPGSVIEALEQYEKHLERRCREGEIAALKRRAANQ